MFSIAFTIYALIQVELSFAEDSLIQLPNGVIRGREAVTLQNKTYYAFEKIPYATPPVGNLRFKPPQPAQNWDGVLNTTHLDVTCYQEQNIGVTESEDCLFLNVFTPKLSIDNNNLLPVMVFIHGGSFNYLYAGYYRADHIIEQDVIYVAMNYRLGVFGFLSTQDEVITGNYGLKDQQLALRWTHDNIKLFGGDPEKITIFGQSAGSGSVAYQLLHQNSQGLFRGAIAQSGTFLNPWSYQRNARKIAFDTVTLLNKTVGKSNDSSVLLNYLQTVDADKLRQIAVQYTNSVKNPQNEGAIQGITFAPVIEVKNPDAFLTNKMYGLLEAGNVIKVPLVIGMTSEEALTLYTADVLKQEFEAFDKHLDWLVSNDTGVTDGTFRTELGNKIREIYTQGEPFLDRFGDGVRFMSDTAFTRGIIKHAELYSKIAKTYFYQFSYDGIIGKNDIHYNGAESVGHAEDNNYIFCTGQECDVSPFPKSDQLTVERMIKLWTNFAKYLNPTPEVTELLQNVTWPVVSSDFAYLDINEQLTIKNNPKQSTYLKWTELYSSLNYTDFDTY